MSMAQAMEVPPAATASTIPVRVAVVDDHESVRLGLKAAFLDDGYNVVLVASNVDELIDGLSGREVDVTVLDLSLGDGSSVTDNVKRVQGAARRFSCTASPTASRSSARRSPRERPASSRNRRQPRRSSPRPPQSRAAKC